MKKIILLLFMMIFLTGCSANYKVEIYSDEALETTSIQTYSNTKESYGGMLLPNFLDSQLNANIPSYFNPENYDELNGNKQANVAYYSIGKSITNNIYELQGVYDFSLNMLYRSRAIKECYDEISVQKNESIYRITTNDKCKAFEKYSLLEDLTIQIVTDYDVIYHNADEVDDSIYTWYLTKNNSNKSIHFVFNTIETDLSDFDPTNIDSEEESDKSNWFNSHKGFTIMVCFLIFIVAILLILSFQHKKES